MSLSNGPDVAGILDALGRHDAAETLRWSEGEPTQREYEAEIDDLEDQLAEAIREQEAAEADLAEYIEKPCPHCGKAIKTNEPAATPPFDVAAVTAK